MDMKENKIMLNILRSGKNSMNVTRAELKEQSRQQMSGKFGALLICFLAVWGVSFICTKGFSVILMPRLGSVYKTMFDAFTSSSFDMIDDIMDSDVMALSAYSNLANVLSLAYWFFVYPMISVGLSQVLLNLTYGDVPQAGTVFEPYKTKFGKSIGTVWLKKLFEILWLFPFYLIWIVIIGVVIAVIASDADRMGGLMGSIMSSWNLGNSFGDGLIAILGMILILILITAVIGAILLIPYSIIISKYAMSVYVMNENPTFTPTQCVNESKAIMQGHRWEFFVLKLSFLPWFLLCLIPFVGWISLAYTLPYMQVTYTNFYHQIKASPLQAQYGYNEANDITEVIEDASNRIMGEGFEQ